MTGPGGSQLQRIARGVVIAAHIALFAAVATSAGLVAPKWAYTVVLVASAVATLTVLWTLVRRGVGSAAIVSVGFAVLIGAFTAAGTGALGWRP